MIIIHHHTNVGKRKINKKWIPEKNKKTNGNQILGRNLIEGMNTCVVPLVRYSGPLLYCKWEELR